VTYYYDQTSYNSLTITNGKGRRTGMSDGSGQTAWSFNSDGKTITEKRTVANVTKSTSYSYAVDDSLLQITYPSGLPLVYDYNYGILIDAWCHQSGYACNGTYFANNVTYAPHGALAGITLGCTYCSGTAPGIPVTYSYNNRLQPSEIKATNADASVTLMDQTYSFVQSSVNNGTVASVTNTLHTGRTQLYTYDTLNRLATAKSNATSGTDCWGQDYTYDRYANLTGISVNQCSAPALGLSVNTSTNQITNPGYRYDAVGNVLSDGSDTYIWNATGLMSSAAGYSYAYDGDNRRVEKSIGGHGRGDEDRNPDPTVHNANGKLYWYGLSGEVLAESDLSGNITSEYIYFGGKRIARRDPGTGNVYYYLADRLGSARIMTDASGNIVHESDFYPYGGERVITNTVDDSHKFTGHERDSETGLDHTLNRQYSSNTGHWLSPDSVKGKAGSPQSWNRYAYTKGNPVSRTDPNGSCDTEVPCGDGSPGDIIATSLENGTVLDRGGDHCSHHSSSNCFSPHNSRLDCFHNSIRHQRVRQ